MLVNSNQLILSEYLTAVICLTLYCMMYGITNINVAFGLIPRQSDTQQRGRAVSCDSESFSFTLM